MKRVLLPAVLAGSQLLLASACRQDMHDQPRFEPFEASTFFSDGRSWRPQVPGTVARGEMVLDDRLVTGKQGDRLLARNPYPLTEELLARGRRNFDVFCTPCHDYAGTGRGMAVRRGLKQPPSFHIDRLLEAPDGHFFDAMTNGFGAMFDYSDRVPPPDRWAIVAYIRALQLSQHAPVTDLPAIDRQRLEGIQ